jgi:hypothetical protein
MTALCVTVLDTVVISRYGPAIWQIFGTVPWMRDALLLMTGVGCFTLADIWSRTLPSVVQRRATAIRGEDDAPIGAGLAEGADV